jgi:hypothetical protein
VPADCSKRVAPGPHLRGPLADEDEERLEDIVGEAGADRDPVWQRAQRELSVRTSSGAEDERRRRLTEDSLDVVDDDDAQRRLVRVGEDLVEVGDLLVLTEADHVLRRDELDEGEIRGEGDRRSERRFAGCSRAYERARGASVSRESEVEANPRTTHRESAG